MSETTIKAQIVAILQAITGIGTVHNRERYPGGLQPFLDLMTSSGSVNGFTVHRINAPSTAVTLGTIGASRTYERSHAFKISGLYALDDENDSESSFQALLDAIFTAFLRNPTLNGTCARHGQFQLDMVDIMQFADEAGSPGDIYHIGEGTLTVYERVT